MYYKARTATDTVPRPPVSRLHRDPANEGPPLVKAFGNCQGGKLRYFPGDDGRTPLHQLKRERSVLLSAGAGPTLFDGNRGHEVNPFVESATSCSHVVNHGKHCGYHREDLVSRIGARGRLWQAASRVEDIVPALVVILAVRYYIVTITSPSRVRTHRRGGPAQ